jgi:hypothetical protein
MKRSFGLALSLSACVVAVVACGSGDENTGASSTALTCLNCRQPPPPPKCGSDQKLCAGQCIPDSDCCTRADCSAPENGSATCVNHACLSSCESGYKYCADAVPANSCIPGASCCTNADCPIPNGVLECDQGGGASGGYCYQNGPICNPGYSVCNYSSCCAD